MGTRLVTLSLPNQRNFAPGKLVYPVDLMIDNRNQAHFYGHVAGCYSTLFMLMAPGCRMMCESGIKTNSQG